MSLEPRVGPGRAFIAYSRRLRDRRPSAVSPRPCDLGRPVDILVNNAGTIRAHRRPSTPTRTGTT